QARLLARAPRPAQAVLATGAAGLVDELAWFERQAAARHIDLGSDPLPATVAYRRLLERLDAADVPVALAMLWAVERAYLDAWCSAARGAPAYQDFVEHWTAPEFAGYVSGLQAAADGALGGSGAEDLDTPFAEVVAAEVGFWDMTWDGSS